MKKVYCDISATTPIDHEVLEYMANIDKQYFGNPSSIHKYGHESHALIEKTNTIGISSGASAPEILVNDFINKLKNRFNISIDEVEIIKEDVIFKIPKKLN